MSAGAVVPGEHGAELQCGYHGWRFDAEGVCRFIPSLKGPCEAKARDVAAFPVRERDWVVVGATPEMLVERGFQPVGRDFPVFLHPDTHEEYALARTERKTAPGYRGFAVHYAPDVTLEDDLLRRDLTRSTPWWPSGCGRNCRAG